MHFVCLVYFDPANVFDRSPEAEEVLGATGAYNQALAASGKLVLTEALQLPEAAVTVCMRDGKTLTTDGPFMETKEILGGIVIVAARDREEAVELAAAIPLAKLGRIEVRPVVDFSRPRPTR